LKIHKKEGSVFFWNSKTHSSVISAVNDSEGKNICKNTKKRYIHTEPSTIKQISRLQVAHLTMSLLQWQKLTELHGRSSLRLLSSPLASAYYP